VSFETSFDSKQPKLVSALSETKQKTFGVSNEPKQTETNRNSLIVSIYWYFFIKFCVVSSCFGLFRFVSKQFVSVVLNSISKQRISMFQLNLNKQKTNQNSVVENIFRYFSENLGLFRFDSKQFCVFWLFQYWSETPKQTKILVFGFRKQTETDLVSVRTEYFFFISRTPYLNII
jgi:hypothetical protein